VTAPELASRLDRSQFCAIPAALEREWLVTNGLGGFASGTVALANTRRYHGLLIAALRPPVERVMLLATLHVTVRHQGRTFELGCAEYEGGVIHPHGPRHLVGFELRGQCPVWTFALAEARLEQRIWMASGRNAVYIDFSLSGATQAAELELAPLCAYRDYHAHQHAGAAFSVEPDVSRCLIRAHESARAYTLKLPGAQFEARGEWYWRFHHRQEQSRGLDTTEDLYLPGRFRMRLEPGQTVTFAASAEGESGIDDVGALARSEQQRQRSLLESVPAAAPQWVRRLTLAADQYLVARHDQRGSAGSTVIAGYPWFADWGRDTMIALPGLALATGRQAQAAEILRTFAAHLSQGMLPNRFPDGGEPPEYNTADATLWFFHALDAYLRATSDRTLLASLFPALEDIIDWHLRGTRYGIRADPSDGLLTCGEPGLQLTWMDAKVGDWVVTPRLGKPVEINALWHFALSAMAQWARELGFLPGKLDYEAAAQRTASSFRDAFWNEADGCLYDVVGMPDGRADRSIRPNQLFSLSLGRDLLDTAQAQAVLEVCTRELLTPVGLRSLSPHDHAYRPRYEGAMLERDEAYHQGTVWSWLLGPYALAHFRVHRDAGRVLSLLEDASRHLDEGCMGQVSEIFDAEPPHAPRGCFAQAWSVAEMLRAWHVVTAAARPSSAVERRLVTRRRS
jgi:predicted glycogen debranching enzyme